ncbi:MULTISPECIES: TlpA family protein disulfide reductase [Mammaliicoccus]|uniref:TlpA family protein disulfide reductase n=1 Tax=Mammaliicoccus vitulinus TaxID=71237 RepID=A0A2T4PVZ8_9STAP|nr:MULTISPECIES: TlpA disulfide reductase family protein [Mammaliicoccus]MBO3076357.1 TlpA family protein disulfide reductase [Mammaliicoccus vitulinus]PTI30653.1 TlpA family protein disulfide reductase [Mammaliicoccus vitulinus]PTI38204.1 TlpA family protein disulfide reductase [Mammaliicoccus vitulinus]PTI72821.1 TlpA family protein disulfide reductase [Mammaliicoccus vitulinus]PTI90637.1 TlpA family protein disulfide reductase [Mammaliicoccus vitulinus]
MKKGLKIILVLFLISIVGFSVYKVIDINKFQTKDQFKEQQGKQSFQNSHPATGLNVNEETVKTFATEESTNLQEVTSKNDITVINLFASWCDPCKREMPELVKYAKNKENGVELVGLNVKDKRKPAEQLIHDVNVNYSIYVAQDDFLKKFKTYNIPTTLFVDKNGEIKKVYLGELSEKTLNNLVTQVKEEN